MLYKVWLSFHHYSENIYIVEDKCEKYILYFLKIKPLTVMVCGSKFHIILKFNVYY